MADTAIVLRIRREGDQAIAATARDLRSLVTAAQAAERALAGVTARAPRASSFQAVAQAQAQA